MKFGRLEGTRIAETFSTMPVLADELMMHVQEIPDHVEPNWTFDGHDYFLPDFVIPPQPRDIPDDVVDAAIAKLTTAQLTKLLVSKGLLSREDLTEALNG